MNLRTLFILLSAFSFLFLISCQTPPTKIYESDEGFEERTFSKIEYGKPVELKRVTIVDVRSRFDYEMSRLPRSFFAYWKDWDLRSYHGRALQDKRRELQRLLALQGIEPISQVVILGKGKKGQGEEFLLATTLLDLGVSRISFMSEKQAKEALVAKNVPSLENVPYWQKASRHDFLCQGNNLKMDITIGSSKPSPLNYSIKDLFNEKLEVKKRSFPKRMKLHIASPGSLWAFGLVLHLKKQGRLACVI